MTALITAINHMSQDLKQNQKNNKNKTPKKHASYVKVPYLINPMMPEPRWLYYGN